MKISYASPPSGWAAKASIPFPDINRPKSSAATPGSTAAGGEQAMHKNAMGEIIIKILRILFFIVKFMSLHSCKKHNNTVLISYFL